MYNRSSILCFLITGWPLSILQAVLVSLPGFSLTSRPFKSFFHTQFFSCRQLHPSQPVIIFAISSYSCVLFSHTFSTDMVDEFCLSQLFYHLQIQAWKIVSVGCNTLHSTVLLLSSKIQDQRNFYKLSHYIFIFCFLSCCFLFVCYM